MINTKVMKMCLNLLVMYKNTADFFFWTRYSCFVNLSNSEKSQHATNSQCVICIGWKEFWELFDIVR